MTAVDERGGPVAGHETSEHGDRPRRRAPAVPPRLRELLDAGGAMFTERLWPIVTLFFVLATAATFTSSWGYYVGDNRFEMYWNPGRRIARTLTIWDGSRGLGRVREDFWPAATAPLAVLRGLGLSATAAEHVFHALMITMAGVGMVFVVRLFRPRIGLEHVLAGLFVAFGPYSATFLIPSNLYYHYALAPWLLVVFFRGVHSNRPWRWAAIFALLVFSPGNVDTPGLVYNAVPVVGVLLYLVLIERSVRLRHALGWIARAGALTLVVNAAMLVKTWLAAAALGQRLSDTEAADVSAFTSSWSESLRGLGNWLSYFPDVNGLLKPQGEPYFTNSFVMVCTFVPPCVALFVLWQSRWRVRILYLTIMLLSAVVLVGAFPHAQPSPLGGRILQAFQQVKLLAAFRNTYKIGAGLVIGVAALFAYGVMLAHRALRRRNPRVAFLPIALAFVTLAGVSFPFWTGGLYDPGKRAKDLPAYWSATFDHLAALPDDGRSLILPQSSRARYRWGWVGDDIFDALDARNHALVTGVPLSTPVAANVLEAVSVIASDPHYTPGVLAPILRRLGITEIVLRNDLDWKALDRPRPSAFDGLRADPDFRRTRTFGRAGQNTAAEQDFTEAAKLDRRYPPVEVWALNDAVGGVRTVGPVAPLVVAGDGYAWAALARAGLLGGNNPVAYTAEGEPASLKADFGHGAPLIVTDTNRRRLRVVLSYEPDYSYTLSPDQQLDRPTQSLWKSEGSQSVAWFPDAASVSLTGPARSVGGSQTWNRPANAFDGDLATTWALRRIDGPLDRVLRANLRHPTEVSEVTFTMLANTPPTGGITRGVLRFSDGPDVPVELTGQQTTVTFDARRTDRVEFVIKEIGPDAQTVGLAELAIPGLDLAEYVQAPDDVFRAAEGDPALAAAVRAAPTGYVFARSVQTTTQTNPLPALTGASSTDEESNLRRRFRTLGEHDFDVSGTFRLRPDTPDEVLDRLVGGDHGAAASQRQGGTLEGYGGFAVDGDPETAWLAPAEVGQSLTLRFPKQTVRTVDLSSVYDGTSSKIDRFQIEIADPANGNQSVVVPAAASSTSGAPASADGRMTPVDPACDGPLGRAPAGCRRTGLVTLPTPIETDHLTVRVNAVSGREAVLGGRIRVDEARINETANKPLISDDSRPGPCLALGLRVDARGGEGTGADIPLTVDGTIRRLLAGDAVPVRACNRLHLSEGWHLLDSGHHAPFDQLNLLEPAVTERLAAPTDADTGSAFTVTDRGPTDLKLRLPDASPGSVLFFNQSWDGGWRAFANGRPLGRPRSLNAMNAWVLDQAGPVDLELRYNPRGIYGWSLPVTGFGLALCLYLALRRPRAAARREDDPVPVTGLGTPARSARARSKSAVTVVARAAPGDPAGRAEPAPDPADGSGDPP